MGGCSPRPVPERFRPYVEATEELARRFAAAGRTPLSGGRLRARRPVPRARRHRRAARPRPDHRRPSRRDRAPGAGLGRRRLDAGRALRDHRLPQGHGRSSRSRRTGPRSTCPTRASPRSPSATTSTVDLSRRDFTINALALRLPDMELIDPFDGLGDLAAGRLRTPLDPEISFGDDPLRMLRAARFAARFSLEPDPALDGRGRAHARPAVHRLRRAHPRRARQDRHGRRALGGAVVRRAHRSGRRVPARAAGPGARAGPDPPAQGRAGAHAGRGGQDVAGPAAAPGRAVPRRRQAAHARHHRRRRELPPSRGRRRAHDADAHGGAALLGRRRRHRGAAGRAAPALPHLPAGLDRQGGAPLRARRRAAPRPAERADPLRLHDAQRRPRPGRWPGAWTSSRRASPSWASRRSCDALRPDLDGNQVMELLGIGPGPRRRPGPGVPHGAAPRRGPARARRRRPARLRAWWAERRAG